MQAGTPRFGSTGLSNIGKGAILLLDLPISVGCTVLISFHVVLQAHHARWKNISVHQSKCGLVIDVFEQGKTLPQQYRIDKQPVPVDEIFRHQRMSGGGAAKNQDFAARAVLELVNFIAQIATDDFRISVIFLQQSFRQHHFAGGFIPA